MLIQKDLEKMHKYKYILYCVIKISRCTLISNLLPHEANLTEESFRNFLASLHWDRFDNKNPFLSTFASF